MLGERLGLDELVIGGLDGKEYGFGLGDPRFLLISHTEFYIDIYTNTPKLTQSLGKATTSEYALR